MKNIFFIILLTCTLFGSDYALVIASKSPINHLSQKQVKDLYLMKLHYINNTKIIPINISATAPIRQFFEKNVLNLDREHLNSYWIKEHFQGISPPLTQSSSASVKMFVKNAEGAVGYIPIDMLDADIKVLYEF